jgi:hypothetical protein
MYWQHLHVHGVLRVINLRPKRRVRWDNDVDKGVVLLTLHRQVMEEFGVSEVVASLGLALYVLGCGCSQFIVKWQITNLGF